MAGLAIVHSGNFPSDCPSYGDVVATDALRHMARISSADNFQDLSDYEYSHTAVGDVTFSSTGVNNGSSGNAYIQTGYDIKAVNTFTIWAAFKMDLNGNSSYNSWVCGNYVSSSVGGLGIYIRSESDPVNSGKFRVVARASMVRKRISDGLFGNQFVDLVIVDNLTSYPSTLGWLVLAMEFDTVSKTYIMRNVVTGATATLASNSTDWTLHDFSGTNRNADPSSVPNHRLMYAASTLDNTNIITLAEQIVWTRLLSTQERTDQLALTRAFLLANRGVTV